MGTAPDNRTKRRLVQWYAYCCVALTGCCMQHDASKQTAQPSRPAGAGSGSGSAAAQHDFVIGFLICPVSSAVGWPAGKHTQLSQLVLLDGAGIDGGFGNCTPLRSNPRTHARFYP